MAELNPESTVSNSSPWEQFILNCVFKNLGRCRDVILYSPLCNPVDTTSQINREAGTMMSIVDESGTKKFVEFSPWLEVAFVFRMGTYKHVQGMTTDEVSIRLHRCITTHASGGVPGVLRAINGVLSGTVPGCIIRVDKRFEPRMDNMSVLFPDGHRVCTPRVFCTFRGSRLLNEDTFASARRSPYRCLNPCWTGIPCASVTTLPGRTSARLFNCGWIHWPKVGPCTESSLACCNGCFFFNYEPEGAVLAVQPRCRLHDRLSIGLSTAHGLVSPCIAVEVFELATFMDNVHRTPSDEPNQNISDARIYVHLPTDDGDILVYIQLLVHELCRYASVMISGDSDLWSPEDHNSGWPNSNTLERWTMECVSAGNMRAAAFFREQLAELSDDDGGSEPSEDQGEDEDSEDSDMPGLEQPVEGDPSFASQGVHHNSETGSDVEPDFEAALADLTAPDNAFDLPPELVDSQGRLDWEAVHLLEGEALQAFLESDAWHYVQSQGSIEDIYALPASERPTILDLWWSPEQAYPKMQSIGEREITSDE